MTESPARPLYPQSSRATALWLATLSLVILAMVVVGGATRATGSGLSITQWKPVSGVIPPLTHDDWRRLFALYRATPQYREINQGMSLDAFKAIFWWEWAHRLLGRLLGVVFLLPFLVLLALRRIPRRLIGRCMALFFLGGAQGAVGWWMVESGLEVRTSVAPERLAAHLGLALLLLVGAIWTALEAWFGPSRSPAKGSLRWAAAAFLGGIFIQCLLGALVAGNHSGLVDADWPLMNGRFFPSDYWRHGMWATLAHGMSATQFDHRVWAYYLFAVGVGMAVAASRKSGQAGLGLILVIMIALTAQIALGVTSLILAVPLPLALAHQFTAVILLAMATALAWKTWRPNMVL